MSFDPNDRAAIDAALRDPDPDNPIAVAVTQRMKELLRNIELLARRRGGMPTELFLHRPATAFDDIVIRLTFQTIADETGHTVKITWAETSAESDDSEEDD